MLFGPRRSVAQGWTVDFSTATPGVMSAAALLAFGGGGLVYTRASAATVQTSATTVDTSPAVDDLCIFSNGTITGPQHEETRTNYCQFSRGQSNSPWFSDTTVTVDTAAGPDGSVVADRVNTSSGHSGARQSITATGTDCTWSIWCRAASGTTSQQLLLGSGGAGSKCVSTASIDTTWRRMSVYATPATKQVYVCEGEDLSSIPGGIAAGARDCIVDMAQFEIGKGPSSFIYTSSAAAARAGGRLRQNNPAALLVGGRLPLLLEFNALWASSDYTANYAIWTLDANNYAIVDYTTRIPTIVIAGVSRTLAALPSWASPMTRVGIWIEAGGGSLLTSGKVRVGGTGGTVTDLGTAAAQPAIVPGANALDLLCSGPSSVFSNIGGLYSTIKPSWA